MRIVILTFGSRGDVQPYVALAKELLARGRDVRLIGPDDFASWVEGHGVPFHGAGFHVRRVIESGELLATLDGKWLELPKLWSNTLRPRIRATLERIWAGARDAEVIVYHPQSSSALDVAEATGAAAVCASLYPFYPTGEFPALFLPRGFGPRINRLTQRLYDWMRAPYRDVLDRWRAETLGLGKGPVRSPLGHLHNEPLPRLCAVSPAVLPRPRDWDPEIVQTGFWFLDDDERLAPDLEAFLDAGPPPVYIGFGSMQPRDPERTTRETIEGVRRAGLRAVLATGWGGLRRIEAPDDVKVVDGAPHAALFSRVQAVVHHGGIGTTAAGLRAGRPTLVCPLMMDQPFWGRRVRDLGCGPEPLPLADLRAEPLARALERLAGEARYRKRAAEVAAAMAAEDGLAEAVEVIEEAGAENRN